MTTSLVLAIVSPFLLLVVVAGIVIVVALVQARDDDVPLVIEKCVIIFKWLSERLPDPPAVTGDNTPRAGMLESQVSPVDEETES